MPGSVNGKTTARDIYFGKRTIIKTPIGIYQEKCDLAKKKLREVLQCQIKPLIVTGYVN